jgi:hypothetical protein
MEILSKWVAGVNGKWVLLCAHKGNHFPIVVAGPVENKFHRLSAMFNWLRFYPLRGGEYFAILGM